MSLYDDVFAALAAADVPYVVVGGIAVVLHGHARSTVDLDLVVDLEGRAARRAVDALLSCGLLPRLPVDPYDFAVEEVREQWRTTRNVIVFSFYDPRRPGREVVVFTEPPRPFGELLEQAAQLDVAGRRVPVASVRHLTDMKRARRSSSGPRRGQRARAVAGPAVSRVDWSYGTPAGLEDVRRREVAELTPDDRLALAEELLELMEQSGVLARLRATKQREIDESWAATG